MGASLYTECKELAGQILVWVLEDLKQGFAVALSVLELGMEIMLACDRAI